MIEIVKVLTVEKLGGFCLRLHFSERSIGFRNPSIRISPGCGFERSLIPRIHVHGPE